MGEQLTKFRGNFTDEMVVQELRGSYPTSIDFAAGVDYDALIAEDRRLGVEPMFLTLPIGKDNATSGNKRHYDAAFVTELMRQTLANKPVGLMGHLSPNERSTAFPPEAVHWVGAARDGDMLWGKGYVPPGPVRERIARYKAQGKSIATSIDAFAEGVWDEQIKAFRMDAKTLRLNQIDLAPADRAGIPDLAAVPIVTTEMDDEPSPAAVPEQPQEPVMDKLQVINEMTADDARLLPDAVRAAIVASVATPPEVAQVQELRQVLGVDDKADLKTLISEMRAAQETQRKATIKARITELAAAVKVEDVRGVVIEMVENKNPQTPQEAETAYNQIVEMQTIKNLLAATVQRKMGPPQTAPVASQQDAPKYFVIPQEA